MTEKESERGERENLTTGGGGVRRKPYEKPQLQVLGDLRDITLGGSGGSGDSGGGWDTEEVLQ